MVSTKLLTWPPGTPGNRNLLRRAAFCGGVVRCVHEDPNCCCLGQCCCPIFGRLGPDDIPVVDVTNIETGETLSHPWTEGCGEKIDTGLFTTPIPDEGDCDPHLFTVRFWCQYQIFESCFDILMDIVPAAQCLIVPPNLLNPLTCTCDPFTAIFGPFIFITNPDGPPPPQPCDCGEIHVKLTEVVPPPPAGASAPPPPTTTALNRYELPTLNNPPPSIVSEWLNES